MFRKKQYQLYNGISKWYQQNGYLIFAFLLPLILMWLIHIFLSVYPFGNNSVLVLDLNGQYVYFFEDLRQKVLSGGSFLYTWTRSLGGEFMGIYAYYLASPFTFLITFFSEEHITEGLLLIFLLKAGSMGSTMAYYLHKTNPSNPINTVIFSTCYAMSSYAVVMEHNTMWIDNLILLPLIALGIERIIRYGKYRLFVVSLSLSILTCFYIGYMTCIFVFLYFFYYYLAHGHDYDNNPLREKNHFIRSLLRIGIFALIAVCIGMIIIYPAYTSLQFGKSTFSVADYSWSSRFDLLDFLAKLLPGSYDTVRPAGLPFVYCGTICLILVPIYFLNSRIHHREKLFGGLFLCVMYLCFNINAIDIVWHGFQKPNWLNYRYSFMFIFLMVVMAYQAFIHLSAIDFRQVVLVTAGWIIILAVIQKQKYEWVHTWSTIGLSALALILLTIVLYFIYHYRDNENLKVAIGMLVVVELLGAGLLHTVSLDDDVTISSRDSYLDRMTEWQVPVDYVKETDKDPFYRMEKTFHRKTNDPMRLGFSGISNSTSTLNKSIIDLLHRFGYASKSHWTKYLGGTPVSDGLLDIRYVISNTDINNGIWEPIHTETVNSHKYTVYRNPLALSLGYAVNENAKDIVVSDYGSPLQLMNDLTAAMIGGDHSSDAIFEKLSTSMPELNNVRTGFTTQHRKFYKQNAGKEGTIVFHVDVVAGQPVYFYLPTDYPHECKLTVGDREIGTLMGNESDCMMYLGTFEYDQTIDVKITLKDDPIYIQNNQEYFFGMNIEKVKARFAELAEGNLTIESFADDKITGTVTATEDKTLFFTSIAFDEGWQCYVDGKKVPLIKTCDSLLAFELTPGIHAIKMIYQPKCYVVGGHISLIGLFAFAVILVLDVWQQKNRKKLFFDKQIGIK